ncbi:MAG TPA: DMT family transporter, partial [Myxococcota bacterium]|nr:DMT family transporter [Myxococcota bacterium]
MTGADLALIGIAALWGASFSVTASLLEQVPPHSLLALRFALALAAFAALRARALLRADAATWGAGALLGAFLYAGFAFQTVGLAYTTPARSAFLTASYVLFVPVLGALFLRERVGAPVAAGAVVATAGLALLLGPEGTPEVRRGDVLTILCALGFALHVLGLGRVAARFRVDALTATQLVTVTILAGIGSVALETPRLALGARAWAELAYLALGCTTLAYLVQTAAQRSVPAARAALIFALEPVFAALVSVGLGRERLDATEIAGGALVVIGVAIGEALRAPTAAARPAAEPGVSRRAVLS